jgi:hypothetical protein
MTPESQKLLDEFDGLAKAWNLASADPEAEQARYDAAKAALIAHIEALESWNPSAAILSGMLKHD